MAIAAWYFLAVMYGGMGNGVAITQVGPFPSEAQCTQVLGQWVEGEKVWRKGFGCYKGVMP